MTDSSTDSKVGYIVLCDGSPLQWVESSKRFYRADVARAGIVTQFADERSAKAHIKLSVVHWTPGNWGGEEWNYSIVPVGGRSS